MYAYEQQMPKRDTKHLTQITIRFHCVPYSNKIGEDIFLYLIVDSTTEEKKITTTKLYFLTIICKLRKKIQFIEEFIFV